MSWASWYIFGGAQNGKLNENSHKYNFKSSYPLIPLLSLNLMENLEIYTWVTTSLIVFGKKKFLTALPSWEK